MMSVAFTILIFCYAVVRYNCTTVPYNMHLGSLLLEFVSFYFASSSAFEICSSDMLVRWRCGRSYVLSRKRLSVLGSNRKNSASVTVTRRREQNIKP